jgi:hypothetical protein
MTAARALLMLMRIAVTLQIIVGIALWTGHWTTLVGTHMMIGSIYVVLLWIIAVIALVRRRYVGLALFAIVWGLVIAWLGYAQQGIMPGSLHWIVRLVHLIVGVSAMPVAERLVGRAEVVESVAVTD